MRGDDDIEAPLARTVATAGFFDTAGSLADVEPVSVRSFAKAAAPSPDLGDTVGTTLNIDNADAIRVYILAVGETTGSLVADATSAYEQARIMAAFATWSDVANIQFVQTLDRAQADIEVFVGDTPPYGSAYFPNGGLQVMFMSNRVPQWTDAGALDAGGFGFLILIHEIGHLIGLTHTHDSDAGAIVMPGVTAAFFDLGDNDLNQEVYSVMSYNRGWSTGPLGYLPESIIPYGSPENPSAIDIIAVQRKYGVNTTTGTGDSVYVMQSQDRSYRTIWDNSGTDEIRHDGTSDAVIDLRAATLGFEVGGGGFMSYLPAFHGGFTIANGVVIEIAIGGDGNDTLTGNDAANTLFGRGGNDSILGGNDADTLNGNADDDTLNGGEGADSMIGGLGDDRLIGGVGAEVLDGSPGGSDTLDYSGAAAQVILGLWNNSVSGDPIASGDTILNFENVITGAGNDVIAGNHLSNHLTGNDGDDSIYGYDGADVLEGGIGDDFLDGGLGDDSLFGGADADTLIGAAGNDTLDGGAGADSMIGGLGDDRLIGGIGAEVLDGSPGDSDTLDYSNATGGLTLRLWNNTVSGDPIADGDTILNFENSETGSGNDLVAGTNLGNVLTGNDGDDTIYGYGGADLLEGGDGTDVIRGGTGNDTISGGHDLDYLSGEADADVFVFNSVDDAGIGALRDQILDFESGVDVIDVSAMAAGAFDFLGTAAFAPSGNAELRLFETPSGSTIVQLDVDGNGAIDAEIRVAGVTGLTVSDFVL
ncbi:M10 family metallopeptidase C-terminal domain-containing protein [Antarctobacter sp.]|uniref:M10 family metallopeptidase C-terminal domain-containing protein n=1 Tax=Antarctobacter sp. TaxID=1872577 RepID=UPI003A92DC81